MVTCNEDVNPDMQRQLRMRHLRHIIIENHLLAIDFRQVIVYLADKNELENGWNVWPSVLFNNESKRADI